MHKPKSVVSNDRIMADRFAIANAVTDAGRTIGEVLPTNRINHQLSEPEEGIAVIKAFDWRSESVESRRYQGGSKRRPGRCISPGEGAEPITLPACGDVGREYGNSRVCSSERVVSSLSTTIFSVSFSVSLNALRCLLTIRRPPKT